MRGGEPLPKPAFSYRHSRTKFEPLRRHYVYAVYGERRYLAYHCDTIAEATTWIEGRGGRHERYEICELVGKLRRVQWAEAVA